MNSYEKQQKALRTYFHYRHRMKKLLETAATTLDSKKRKKALSAAEKVGQKILENLLIANLRLSAGENTRKSQSPAFHLNRG